MRLWPGSDPEPPRAVTADDLMRAALAADAREARGRLTALACLDAARWLAWPAPRTDALSLEARLSHDAPHGDEPAERLLRQSLVVRRAAREGRYDDGVTALRDLPAGYPRKSLWLHWRDLLEAAERLDRWPAVRRQLTAELQQHGVPASETLPALLGELDTARWRAETRLCSRLAQRLGSAVERQLPRLRSEPAQRWHQAALGRELVRADALEAGAALIHAAAEALERVGPSRAGRLFSRPAPEAAAWLRAAIDRVATRPGGGREPVGFQAVLAMIATARRQRAGHLLSESLEPLPARLSRGELGAVVQLEGALAWLGCGQPWIAASWFRAGHGQLLRILGGPLAPDAAQAAIRFIELLNADDGPAAVADIARRARGTLAAELRAELARLYERADDHDAAWEELAAAYRGAYSSYVEHPARVLTACATCQLEWDHQGAGLALLGEALSGAPAPPAWPPEQVDAEQAETALREQLAGGTRPYDLVALAVRALLRTGRRSLAQVAWDAADATVDRIDNPGLRLRGELTLARAVNRALDVDLRAAVDAAVAEEAARQLERLRS